MVDAAANGDFEAALDAMRLGDEVRAAVEVSCAEKIFEPPDRKNLRLTMARFRRLVEPEDQ